jgi:DNA-binding beta-propeller fold protein YncE
MLLTALAAAAFQQVGDGVVATGHLLDPIGKHLVIKARPVDIALSPKGDFVLVKENRGLTVLKTSDWSIVSEQRVQGGASMHGLVCTPEGNIFFSDAGSAIHTGKIAANGTVTWGKNWTLPVPKVKGAAYPCGMAPTSDGGLAVCASRSNALVLFDSNGAVKSTIDLDIAPFGVAITEDGRQAVVSCWGKKPGRRKSGSSDTDVDVDPRGISTGGMIEIIDLTTGKVTAHMPAGLQPSEVVIDQGLAYIPNANSDTLGIYDIAGKRRIKQLIVKPDDKLPFGSAPNSLAVSRQRQKLYVCCGGNNAVAVLSLGQDAKIKGFFPTNWYPGGIRINGDQATVACIKGIGSRNADPDRGFNVHRYTGSITQATLPTAVELSSLTAKVHKLSFAPEILQNMERSTSDRELPKPVPAKLGEPSPIQHVVYVLKENRTYDQVLGDIGRGDSQPKLTIYGAQVTPNHHALANEFVLLDNYYCNGVNSADGHSWAMEGIASSYLERSFGGFTRSYPFGGDDALATASSGFIWDSVLAGGRSFRNYGEGDYASMPKGMKWKDVYDANARGEKLVFPQRMAIDKLRRYSCRDYPGWNMGISDQVRCDVFLRELKEFEKKGTFPNFTIVYLPQDHTSGTSAGMPEPKSDVADNDYAVGRVVDALSHTKFWSKMAIFVIEDDPQDGFDHVDGHRSFCLVASPYARRGALVSKFYNQTSVIHTMLQMLGIPPLNQMDAASPLMSDCFQSTPDLGPYTLKPNQIQIDKLNVAKTPAQKQLMAKSQKLDFTKPDVAGDAGLNRILWQAARGSARYPLEWEGAHGKGLKKRGLKLAGGKVDDD